MDNSRLVQLGEIDDWELYAKGLESYVMWMHERIGVWKDAADESTEERLRRGDLSQPAVQLICNLNGDLNSILRQSAARADRFRRGFFSTNWAKEIPKGSAARPLASD